MLFEDLRSKLAEGFGFSQSDGGSVRAEGCALLFQRIASNSRAINLPPFTPGGPSNRIVSVGDK